MESFGKKWKSGRLSKDKQQLKSLTLYNDDINSFEFVIQALCEVCDHNDVQAEQCAFLTHFTGKCQIKIGTKEELSPIHKQLQDKQLSVTIE